MDKKLLDTLGVWFADRQQVTRRPSMEKDISSLDGRRTELGDKSCNEAIHIGECCHPTDSCGYVRTLARNFYGIEDVELIKAVGLDIDGADAEAIIRESLDHIGTAH